MNKAQNILLVCFFILFSSFRLLASDDEMLTVSKCSRLNIGVINSYYNYNGKNYSPGFIIEHNYCIKPKEHMGFGLGTGLIAYKQQYFLPIYFDMVVCSRSDFFGNFQAGYAFGWEDDKDFYKEYSLNGGIYSAINLGYRFRLTDEFNACLSAGYNHQFAHLKSETLEKQTLHFNSFVITLGIMLESR